MTDQAKIEHWELYQQLEEIALEIDAAPMWQKQAALEKLFDLVSSTLVNQQQQLSEHDESDIDLDGRVRDLEAIVARLALTVLGKGGNHV